MSIRQIVPNSETSMQEAAVLAVSVLHNGGVVIYPSDSVYGIMCRADDFQSVNRISGIKGYDSRRPFILIVNGLEMAESVADISDTEVKEILKSRWPGKLTFALPAKDECPEWVRAGDDTIAIRHPADPLSNLILSKCGVPLVSTSANLCNDPPVLSLELIDKSIIQNVDLIIDGGHLPESSPSTVIKLLRGRT